MVLAFPPSVAVFAPEHFHDLMWRPRVHEDIKEQPAVIGGYLGFSLRCFACCNLIQPAAEFSVVVKAISVQDVLRVGNKIV
ncbi:MAG TPA: hypothetical protein VF490_14160 [Chryseosolibacter sp.]